MRPDLPNALLAAVDRALDLDPARRPAAAALVEALRAAGRRRRGAVAAARPSDDVRHRARRSVAAALAATVAGWTTWTLPFFPQGWPLGLAALAAATTALSPRAGLAVTLAIPILPLGNVALGVAALYATIALALFLLSWSEPETGLGFAVGPLLAPLAALGFLPLVAQAVWSSVRRAAQVAAAVTCAAIVAGVRGAPLPFEASHAPEKLGLEGSEDPLAVAAALSRVASAHPALVVEAVALAAAAAVVPAVRARGPWAVAGLGAALLAVTLLPVATVAAAPLVVAIWATCGLLVLR
jgi:hypothetical protein